MNEEFEPGTGSSADFSDDPGAEKLNEEAMIEEGRAAAILAYVPFLCFVPLIKMKENPFALRHGKQGLLLFIIEVVAVFFMFDFISDLFWGLVLILAAATAVVGILYSLQGKEFTIPYLGKLADKLKI